MLNLCEKKVLDIIQRDIPLVKRPWEHLAKEAELSEKEFLECLRQLKTRDIIRNIAPLFRADRLGYKSTLIAASVNHPPKAAEVINAHPGVSHNYLREHKFNLWFTLTIKKEEDFNREAEALLGPDIHFRVLPSLKTYKIGVNFSFGTMKKRVERGVDPFNEKVIPDEAVVRVLQKDLELTEEPWMRAASQLGISQDALLHTVDTYKRAGIIKRISGVLRHRKAGFLYNGMACFSVGGDNVDRAGEILARSPSVSHCYHRRTYEDWPYNLFAMVHSQGKESCLSEIKELSEKISCSEYETLFSTREFKKERVRFFT